MDEISQRQGHQDFATVVCDIDRGKLLEVIDSHHQSDIIRVLMQQPIELREQVEEVSMDIWGGFPRICATRLSALPNWYSTDFM